jgi:arylsulfatase A-like enzyme
VTSHSAVYNEPPSDASRQGGGIVSGVLLPALLSGAVASSFAIITFVGSPLHESVPTLLRFSAFYGLLGVGLSAGLIAAARIGWLLGFVAALGAGSAIVWQYREVYFLPHSRSYFAAWSAGVGLVLFLIVARAARRANPWYAGLTSAGAFLLLAAGLVATFEASGSARWQLLRHHKLLGTPIYYLVAEPVESVRSALWSAHASTAGPAPPGLPAWTPPAQRPPNLVFILVDTLRADGLSAYGGKPDLMPELNAIAARSWVFQDVLVNATWTRPSVASLFTGLLPEEHGAVDRRDALPPERVTLAEILANRGYTTAAFVANFGAVGRDWGFAQGFDYFDELDGGQNAYARAEQVNRAVDDWLANRNSQSGAASPLFLYVHYLDPHLPYLAGGPAPLTPTTARVGYEVQLRYLDIYLARLYELIDRRLAGPTFVFLISDHGEEFGEHGERGHGHSLYPELVHVPALLRTPRGESGVTPEALTGRDFFTLLLDLAGSPDLDIASWARQNARSTRLASSYGSTLGTALHRPYLRFICTRSIEQSGLFLIWSGYGPTVELYDLARDPGARKNLADDEPERVRAMLRALDASPPGSWSQRRAVEPSAATHEQLKALGYVE